jgi:hypothetical protein
VLTTPLVGVPHASRIPNAGLKWRIEVSELRLEPSFSSGWTPAQVACPEVEEHERVTAGTMEPDSRSAYPITLPHN